MQLKWNLILFENRYFENIIKDTFVIKFIVLIIIHHLLRFTWSESTRYMFKKVTK